MTGSQHALPPAALRSQVGSAEIEDFLQTGQRCAQDLEAALRAAGKDFSSFTRILDFGCGCGRTIAWLRPHAPAARLHGTDLHEKAIAWCRDHLTFAAFTVNAPRPPLDYPAQTFDLVYAISVFTHLDEEAQFAWLGELRRVIRPQGIALLSVHGRYDWERLPGGHIATVTQAGIYCEPSRSLCPLYREHCHSTYHTKEYILDRWSAYFTILEYRPRGINNHQDLVVLRNDR